MSGRDVPEPTLGRGGLSEQEVGALWAFLHGDIMIGGVRERIREHWGLCPRHAWGHAVVEIELWEQGAGARQGHQPFDVGVLYQDLLDAMIRRLGSSPRSPRRTLRGRGRCYLCQQLDAPPEVLARQIGYAGFGSGPLTEETNRLAYTRQWLKETAGQWQPQLCPRCLPGSTGQICRLHLLAGDGPDEATVIAATDHLHDVRARLGVLIDSMTEHGRPSTPAADASWIQALGWFHSWSFPIDLATT